MSIIPAFRAALDTNITAGQQQKLAEDIRRLRGVVGVHFQRAADGEKCLLINHMPGSDAERTVAAMAGVARTYPAGP